jgi:hypothetical protein
MLFFLIVTIGFLLQLLWSVGLLVFDIEQLTIMPSIIVALWYIQKGDAFRAFAAAFILALTATLFGGGTRGIVLLSIFSGVAFAVVARVLFRSGGWFARFLHTFSAAIVAQAIAAGWLPLFGVGEGFGSIFVQIGLLSAVLTAAAAFPIHGILNRLDPILQAGSSTRRMLR